MSPPTATASSPAQPAPATKKTLHPILDVAQTSLAKLKIDDSKAYEFDDLTPAFPDIHRPALQEVAHDDRALYADASFKNLFAGAAQVKNLTPKVGTEIIGVSLADLSDAAKDELALLTSYRGVVFFRDQSDLSVDKQLALGRYWGKLHSHATTALPKAWKENNWEDVHVVFADSKRKPNAAYSQTFLWHSDVSYEIQPPSYTTLKLLDGPREGGDTAWALGYAVYDQLSPSLKTYLEGLTALHSAVEQANDAKRAGKAVRRDPVVSEHPVVRTHPVTGYKSIFVNPGFTRGIKGVPKAEGDAILNYLYNLIATSIEYSVRFKWEKNDVAVWDNRICYHTASYGFYPGRRHAVRVTVHGEKPYYDGGKSQQDEIDEQLGFQRTFDGTFGGNYND